MKIPACPEGASRRSAMVHHPHVGSRPAREWRGRPPTLGGVARNRGNCFPFAIPDGIRERRGESLQTVVTGLGSGWSTSKLSRYEVGSGLKLKEVERLLG